MKVLRFYIRYRLPIAILLIGLGILSHIYDDAITAWLLYIAAAISLLLYFTVGTMRLVHEAVAAGEVEKAQTYIKKIKFPRLLFKPIRSAYYMLQSNLSLASDDLTKAENSIRQNLKIKSKIVGDTEGTSLMQLAFIQFKKGETKEARLNFQAAIKAGIPDKENLAAVYLQLSSMEIQRQQNKVGRDYLRRAKALKPKSKEIVRKMKELENNLSRLPA